MRECWNSAHRMWIQCQEQFWGQRWPMSSMSLVKNLQCPPSHWWWGSGSCNTSNHARKLKFGTQVGNHLWRTFKMSKITCVLHVSWQEPSKSPKTLMMTRRFLKPFIHARNLKFGTKVRNHIWRTFKMSRMTHVFNVSSQEHLKSSKSLMMIGRFLTYF